MALDTEDLIEKDEDLKATESRIIELHQNKTRSPEEEKEFLDLKKHHRGRVEEQIMNEREKADKQSERAAAAEQALADARERLRVIEEKRETTREVVGGSESETYEVNGKKFYTDEAIQIRVSKGLMSQKDGWAMQRQAIKEEAKAEMAGDEPKKKSIDVRNQSLEYVRKKGYGWMLDEKDPKHNPKDPLYKLANKLWLNGYQYDPDGPRKALDDAMELSGKNIQREDLSDELGVPKNNAAASSIKEKKIELDDIESANARRFYVLGNVINPKTGKHYTEQEALVKALEAKRKRLIKA